VPAITGTRRAATSTVMRITASYSSDVSVGASPVVPHATSAEEPPAICRSISFASAASSRRSLRNGVTSATIDPSNMVQAPTTATKRAILGE
jgi:hypothetical protein